MMFLIAGDVIAARGDQLRDVFFEIHRDLPREGPGERASTLRALRAVMNVTAVSRILDVGCGPGIQTLALASALDGYIVALDTHAGYLRQLRVGAERDHVSEQLCLLRASMFELPVLPESIDVMWAEGSIYIIGFEQGLREWRRCVRRGGCVAVTHLSWLTDDAPDEPRAFWARHFPAMATVGDNLRVAGSCGYDVIEHFTLPDSAWWADYYHPLERRLTALRDAYSADSAALAVIAGTQEQIDLFRRFSPFYGYVFYVLRRA